MQMRVFRQYGWRRDLPDHNDVSYKLSGEFLEDASTPDEKDLVPVMPAIQNQGNLGSCVGFGVGACFEHKEILSISKDLQKEPEYFSKQYEPLSKLFFYYGGRNVDGTTNYDSGTQLRSVIKAAMVWGMCRDKVWPYIESKVLVHPNFNAYEEGAKHKLIQAYRIDHTKPNQIMQCLANGFPIAFGMSLGESWEDVGSDGLIPELKPGEMIIGGHCMCIVGYKKSIQRYKVRNSWGENWGDHGHAWIPFDMIHGKMAGDFWTLRKKALITSSKFHVEHDAVEQNVSVGA